MIKRFYLLVPVLILVFMLTTLALYLSGVFNYSEFLSVSLSLIITTLNFLAGFLSAKISLSKNEKTFIKIVFGSMVIRLFLLLFIILIVLIFLDINRNSFIFSIFIFYVFYLLIEVFYLNYRKN